MDDRRNEFVVAARHVPVSMFASAPRLRWYQRWYAGVEDLVQEPTLRGKPIIVTNARGVHAEPVAEHVFGMEVIGVRRRPDLSKVRCVGLSDLHTVLPEADVVVCALPLTAETRGWTSRTRNRCRPTRRCGAWTT